MLKKISAAAAVLSLTSGLFVQAEVQRARVTTENKFVEPGKLELGMELRFLEGNDRDEEFREGDFNITSFVPYARFGILDHFGAEVEVPLSYSDVDGGSENVGFGDIMGGIELLAYEDIFDYYYIIPHAHLELKTGDEDDLLGTGDNTVFLGVSVGSKYGDALASSHGEHFTWIIDGTYAIRSDHENQVIGGLSVIYDISKEFAILGEVQISDKDIDGSGHPTLFQGGMTYNWSDSLHFGLYGGGVSDSLADSIVTFKTAYQF